MLLRIIRLDLGRVRLFRRRLTVLAGSQGYSQTVRAFPFSLSSKEAIFHLGPYASKACMFKGISGSLGARIFGPGWGFKPIEPTRIQPVYFPAWFIDAELEASAWLTLDGEDSQSEQRTVTAFLSNSYIPGFAFEPLSRMSFNIKASRTQEPIPFTEDLAKQHEEEILCLPYTISPLSLLKNAHSLSYKQATICDHIRFLPGSVKANFLAAYPVLIPLYLARYDFEIMDESHTVNLVLEASSRSGRIICEVVTPVAREYLNVEFTSWRNSGGLPRFVNVDRFMAPLHKDHFAHKSAEWAEDMLSSPGSAHVLASISDIDLDDPRVREFVESEKRANRNYMSMGIDVLAFKEVLKTLSGDRAISKGKIIQVSFDLRPKVQTKDLARGSTQDIITSMEEKRTEMKPQWWTDWENSCSNHRTNT